MFEDRVIKIISIIMIIIILIAACEPSNDAQDMVVKNKSSMFIKIEDGVSWDVYYHRITKVMYVVSDSSYNSGNFVLLVNSDGSPMVFNEDYTYYLNEKGL